MSKHSSPIRGCTCCRHNMFNILKVGNFRLDFNPYELYTQTYTQKYSCLKYSREITCLPWRKNLANESLRNCDIRQVFVHPNTEQFSAVLNPIYFSKFLSFQLFQSEIMLVKCCKEVIVPLELVFFRIFLVFHSE